MKAETEKVPEKPESNPFDEFDVGTFFNQYLDTGGDGGKSQEREVSERPSFEKFLSSPSGLTDHLTWQLSVTICSDAVKQVADNIIGNLDENGYLTASTEELTENGKYSQDDLDDALAVVQEFDPIGVGARDLRECLLLQIKAFELYKSNPDEAAQAVAKELAIDKAESLAEMKELIWLSSTEQLSDKYLGTSSKKGEFVKTLKATADFLVEQKAIDSAPGIEAFEKAVNPKYIEGAVK